MNLFLAAITCSHHRKTLSACIVAITACAIKLYPGIAVYPTTVQEELLVTMVGGGFTSLWELTAFAWSRNSNVYAHMQPLLYQVGLRDHDTPTRFQITGSLILRTIKTGSFSRFKT